MSGTEGERFVDGSVKRAGEKPSWTGGSFIDSEQRDTLGREEGGTELRIRAPLLPAPSTPAVHAASRAASPCSSQGTGAWALRNTWDA